MAKAVNPSLGRRLGLVGLILVAFALYEVSEHYSTKQTKLASVSSLGRSVTGASVYYEWSNQIQPDSSRLLRHAFLESKDLMEMKTIAILSPLAALSQREVRLIDDFVKQGGKLILSYHDLYSFMAISPLLKKLEMTESLQEQENFKNGEPTVISPEADQLFFKKGEPYAFYSLMTIGACSKPSLTCYVLEKKIEKGAVVLLAGFPFFSNGLIGKSNNSDAALRLKDWAKEISFDEYHHFFSDRTVWDLVRNASFSVPLFGMTLLLILFFIFGHTKFHERHREVVDLLTTRSLHDWNEGIVASSLTSFSLNTALKFQYQEVEKILRSYKDDEISPPLNVKSRDEMLKEATKLISEHRKVLLRRRRIQT